MHTQTLKTEISVAEMVTALLAGSAALLVLGLQPILLGELVEARQVTLEGVGLVAMAEIVALGIGVLLGDLARPLKHLRTVTAMATLCALALDALTPRVSGDLGFALVRAAAGLAEGLLVWATTAVIVRCANPARLAGVFFVVQTAVQALTGLALARWVIPTLGWQGAFQVVAALMLLPLLLARAMPRGLQPLAAPAQTGFRWSRQTGLPLLTVFLQMATLGSLWAYLEPLGKGAGFEAKDIQTLIAAALGMQIVGGCAGSALVRRLHAWPTLLAGSALLAAIALAVSRTPSGGTWQFAALCAAFAFVWLFIAPYQMGLAFDADGSGRVASLVPAAQLFGIAFGPLVASFVVEGENAAAVPMVSAAFAAAAALALLASASARRTLARAA
ncbi:putative MFS family arabinose efflux permease [Pelomonas aquatica]|uniref:MFS family arabinose efflux permease n=1 Tax=Pelomonas aquatica TaxID=431058 RepID=A0ABU1Z472_9BURK|nr:MFS transporter [Pelomonas aquatica]MDR7295400.1 putative MFS family arabinose efflux permease [Pelomonas aquatica]